MAVNWDVLSPDDAVAFATEAIDEEKGCREEVGSEEGCSVEGCSEEGCSEETGREEARNEVGCRSR
jgi:hypothetical protein